MARRDDDEVTLAGLPLMRMRPATEVNPLFSPDAWGSPAVAASRRRTVQPAQESGVAVETDWAYVTALAEVLKRRVTELDAELSQLTGADLEQRQRSVVSAVIREESSRRLKEEGTELGEREFAVLLRALLDLQWGHGRFQPYLDNTRLENLEVDGYDRVWAEYSDESAQQMPPIAESDEALIEWLQRLAAQHGREFSEAVPFLNLQLAGGARLAASAWVTPRPHVTIRRHRLKQVTLTDLVRRSVLSAPAAKFLSAATQAGWNIVIAGQQNAGKTTVLRALAGELPYQTRIATIETERELFLHEMPDRHRSVVPFEARAGSLERGLSSTGRAGAVSLSDILAASQRHSIDRTIVGEVRGSEFYPMIMAMLSGAGTMSTVHAREARATVNRLAMLAMTNNPQMTVDYARQLVADAIDVIVFCDLLDDEPAADGAQRRHRWISEILVLETGERGWASNSAYTGELRSDGTVQATMGTLPPRASKLRRFGFDAAAYPAGTAEVLTP